MIDRASTWDLDARMQVVRLLAEFPEVRVNGPSACSTMPSEAAELDEPGAMTALIELKLPGKSPVPGPAGEPVN